MNEAVREDLDDEIAISDILVALGQEKKTLIATTLVGICASVALALLLPRYYTASTVLLPPQQQSSGAANALAQLGGALGGLAGMGAGISTPDEMYLSLLNSRSVQDDLIAQLKLKQHYKANSLESTRNTLRKQVAFSSDKKSGLITVEASDTDPAFAAKLANAHVNALRNILSRIALTSAQQQRQFLQDQVTKTQNTLNVAEVKFRQAQSSSGLVVTQALAEGVIREGAQLRGQIAAREVQLQTLARFATPNHPDVQRTNAELAALRRQLTQIEQGTGATNNQNEHGMEAVQAFRDMKVQETMLKGLITQLEMARADEAREGPLLQQVDIATAPETPSKPKRPLVIIVGSLIGMIMGLLLSALNHTRKNKPEAWKRVKAAWF